MGFRRDEAAAAQRQEWGLAIIRAAVGLTFLMHGWQKVFEMGVPGVAGFFGMIGIPSPTVAATVVSWVELVGGAALLVGLATRWVAIPLAIDMLVATTVVHLPNGFFVGKNGFELTLLLLAGAVGLILAGPGALAVDRLVGQGRPSEEAAPGRQQTSRAVARD